MRLVSAGWREPGGDGWREDIEVATALGKGGASHGRTGGASQGGQREIAGTSRWRKPEGKVARASGDGWREPGGTKGNSQDIEVARARGKGGASQGEGWREPGRVRGREPGGEDKGCNQVLGAIRC